MLKLIYLSSKLGAAILAVLFAIVLLVLSIKSGRILVGIKDAQSKLKATPQLGLVSYLITAFCKPKISSGNLVAKIVQSLIKSWKKSSK